MSDPVSDFNAKQSAFYETHDRTIPATPDEDTQPMSPPDVWPIPAEELAAICEREWQVFLAERTAAGRPPEQIESLKHVFTEGFMFAWKTTE